MPTHPHTAADPLWKRSVFSVEVPFGTSTILFNTFRRTLVQLTPNLNRILSTNEAATRKLAHDGYLVASNKSVEDEYDSYFDAISRQAHHLNLLFTPNTTCNLACAYCFENRVKRSAMSHEVVDATLSWLRERMTTRNIRQLSLNLFGGEPMLEYETLIYFLKQCNKILAEKDAKYRSVQLTTNGLHQDVHHLRQLANLGVTEAQITFDGPTEINDKRRRRRGRQDAPSLSVFNEISRNLHLYAQYFSLTIKINFDRTTAPYIGSFLDELLRKSNLAPGDYLIKPEPIAAWTNKSESYNKSLFTRGSKELGEIFAEILVEIDSRGIPLDLSAVFPTPCMVSSEDSFLLEPTGELRSCISAFGMRDFFVGDVRDFRDTENDRSRFRVSRLWPHVQKCSSRSCSFMPICDGGCRYETVVDGNNVDTMFCGYDYYKEVIPAFASIIQSRSYKTERYFA